MCAARASRSQSRSRVAASCSTAQRAKAPISRAQLERPAERVALPEGHGAGRAGRGGDDHAVAADLLDPPGGGAEHERLPGAGLVDHLLVELADAAPVGERDGVEAAVGDRAGVGDRQLARAAAGADHARDAVPDDARAQADRGAVAEGGVGVAPVEHVEHALEQLAGKLGVGPGVGDERVQVVDGDAVRIVLRGDGDRDDVLGEDVEGVARDDGRLDRA